MSDSLCLIRRKIISIERSALSAGARDAPSIASTGHRGIDRALGGGLERGRLHEILAETASIGSASGFAVLLSRIIGGDLLWLAEDRAWHLSGSLYPGGLVAMGLDPTRMIVAALADSSTVLRAALDGLRCPALGSVVIEVPGNPRALDLVASRRLSLAAQTYGVTAILLRSGGDAAPNSAQTRWRVAAAQSTPLAANAPGHPVWEVELLRQRGRPDGGQWRVEWNREQGKLRDWHDRTETPLSGAVAAVSFNRPVGAGASVR